MRYSTEQAQKNTDKQIQRVSSHFNLVADVMPSRNEYVLVKTPFCKYPATVGYWNGAKWLAADDKCEIVNVSEWLALNGCYADERKREFSIAINVY